MPKTLRTELQRLRKVHSLSQEVLADKLKMKRTTYAQKEKLGSFTDDEIEQLSKILGASFDLLNALEREPDAPGIVRNADAFLVQSAIRQESMLRVLLWSVAEILADKRQQPLARVIQQLETDATSESQQRLAELR